MEMQTRRFRADHWFIVVSSQERCDTEKLKLVNGVACFTLRGGISEKEIRLNGADGCANSLPVRFFYPLPKTKLHSPLGSVSWERQQ